MTMTRQDGAPLIGLPRGESAARDEICDALTEAIVWLGELADAANESTTLDIRRDRHVGEDDGSLTVRALMRLLTQNERDARHRTDMDEMMERTWQRVGRALVPTARPTQVPGFEGRDAEMNARMCVCGHWRESHLGDEYGYRCGVVDCDCLTFDNDVPDAAVTSHGESTDV